MARKYILWLLTLVIAIPAFAVTKLWSYRLHDGPITEGNEVVGDGSGGCAVQFEMANSNVVTFVWLNGQGRQKYRRSWSTSHQEHSHIVSVTKSNFVYRLDNDDATNEHSNAYVVVDIHGNESYVSNVVERSNFMRSAPVRSDPKFFFAVTNTNNFLSTEVVKYAF